MRVLSVVIVGAILLLAGLIFGWYSWCHAIVGAPALAAAVALWAWILHARGEDGSEDEMDDDEPDPFFLTMAKAVFKGGLLSAGLLLVFAVSDTVGLANILVPREPPPGEHQQLPPEFVQKLVAFGEAAAWGLIVETVDRYVAENDPPAELRRQLAESKYNAYLQWGVSLPLCDEAKAKLAAAIEVGSTNGRDTRLAIAELGRVEAKCASQPAAIPTAEPAALITGCQGSITGADTAQFPPAISLYVSLECPSPSGGMEVRTGLRDTDFVPTVSGKPAEVWIGGMPGSRDRVRVLLIMDVSGSMEGEAIENAKQGAKALISSLSDQDEVAVLAFSGTVRRVQDWTTNKNLALSAVDSLRADGTTALYDAIWQGVDFLGPSSGLQRVIILLTDGANTSGARRRDEAIQKAVAAGVPVYVIGLATSSDYDGATAKAIATGTGVLLLETPSPSRLAELYSQIGGKIRQVYRVMVKTESWQNPTLDVALSIGGRNAVKLERTLYR